MAHPTIDDNETTNEADREEEEKETCDEIFATNGMNFTSFYEGAAHGIHSLRLNIMKYNDTYKEDELWFLDAIASLDLGYESK